MLAGVEDQEDPLVPQVGDQAGCCVVGPNRQPQHGGHGRARQIGSDEQSEVDEEHGAGEGIDQFVGDRDRDGGLADTATADNRDEPLRDQGVRNRQNVVGAPDHAGQAAWQVCVRKVRRLRRGFGNWILGP